jgi:type IV secretion system protein VirB9
VAARLFGLSILLATNALAADAARNDPRLREVEYDSKSVVTLYAKRGVTTHVLLNENEHVEFVGTGVGSDCGRAEDAWCVVAPQGGTQLFVKPKGNAQGQNNVAVATNRRAYSLRFVMVADDDPRQPVYRLTFNYPAAEPKEDFASQPSGPPAQPLVVWPMPSPADLIKSRLKRSPGMVNGDYSITVGKRSGDIAPSLVFDDGRFTYFQFPNNREIPAVFHIDAEGEESVVNARMENDFLVADRVAERFYLRRGKAVIGIYNEAFDLDGIPPANGTTIPGVARVYKGGGQ